MGVSTLTVALGPTVGIVAAVGCIAALLDKVAGTVSASTEGCADSAVGVADATGDIAEALVNTAGMVTGVCKDAGPLTHDAAVLATITSVVGEEERGLSAPTASETTVSGIGSTRCVVVLYTAGTRDFRGTPGGLISRAALRGELGLDDTALSAPVDGAPAL
jgi:hypothetical protein